MYSIQYQVGLRVPRAKFKCPRIIRMGVEVSVILKVDYYFIDNNIIPFYELSYLYDELH